MHHQFLHSVYLRIFFTLIFFIPTVCSSDGSTTQDELGLFNIQFESDSYISENAERLGGSTIVDYQSILERPHDGHSGVRGLSEDGFIFTKKYYVYTAPGSSLRFRGKFENKHFGITTEPNDWLHFRRTDDGWVYLAGKGRFHDKQTDKVLQLGADRSKDWFVTSLLGTDTIGTERAIYELERYPEIFKSSDVHDRIMKLLTTDSRYIPVGASYILGILGTKNDVPYLKETFAQTKNEFVRFSLEDAIQRIEER